MNRKRRRLLQGFLATAASPGLAAGQDPRDVVFLDATHSEFAKRRTIFNKRIALTPRVIALCATEAGVVQAVRYAAKAGLPVAIKSGGHCFEGFSLNDGGLVVDLGPMSSESLSAFTERVPSRCSVEGWFKHPQLSGFPPAP